MAYWQKKNDEHEQTVELLQQQPDLTVPEIAEQMGVARTTVERRLPSLEEAGYLLAEDDRGRITFVGHRKL